jgi:hypothetical protein
MKGRRLFLISSILLFIVLLGASAQEKYVPKADEELYGTWTNKEYSGSISYQPQKEVVTADRYGWYHLIPDSVPYEEGTYEIDRKWTDAEGNIWYRILCTAKTGAWKDYNLFSAGQHMDISPHAEQVEGNTTFAFPTLSV